MNIKLLRGSISTHHVKTGVLFSFFVFSALSLAEMESAELFVLYRSLAYIASFAMFLGFIRFSKDSIFNLGVVSVSVYVVSFILSGLVNNRFESWVQVFLYLYGGGIFLLVFLFFSTDYFRKEGGGRAVSLVFLYVSFLLLCLSLFFSYLDRGWLFFLQPGGFSGIYNNRNQFGMVASIGTVVSLFWLLRTSAGGLKIPLAFLFSVFALATVFSLSRASWLLMIIGCLLVVIPVIRLRYILAGVFALCVLFILASSFDQGGLVSERLSDGTTSGRAVVWKDALEVGSQNVFFGIGPYAYHYDLGGKELHAHNIHLNNFANLGFLGALAWAAFSFFFLSVSFYFVFFKKSRGRDKGAIEYIYLFSALNIGVFVNQLFESGSSSVFSYIGFVYIITCAYLMSRLGKD